MLGAPSSLDLDHADESYNIYSQLEPSQHLDLYDLLLHEPTNSKKPSILYDYSPPQTAVLSADDPTPDLYLNGMKMSPNSS
jgi:hypothetical protein